MGQELSKASQELLAACKKGGSSRVARALAHGADPNASEQGKSALVWAIQAPPSGSEACVELLLSAGAQVDSAQAWKAAFNRDQNARYEEGGYLSARWAQSGVSRLLAAGADWRVVDEIQRDALMSACWSFRVRAAHELLDAGADPLRRDKHGLQALSMLIYSMTEQGASSKAIPTVKLGFELLERLALMGSDFDQGPLGRYGPILRLQDLGFPEGRELSGRVLSALEAQRLREDLSASVEPAEPSRRSPRV